MLIMNYQLIIQLQEKLYGNLDWIAEIEDNLDESLVDAEVDGHDIGSGQVNIFIHTNNPVATFEVAKNILLNEDNSVLEHIKVAYRELSTDCYICLWPKDLAEFKIL
jgi:hypothetical protein